jgi:hypothetical protein
MGDELTDAEVERIDLLHNATDEYLAKILNFTGGYVEGEYNMRLIDHVLDAVWNDIKDKGWISEMDFYPYRES